MNIEIASRLQKLRKEKGYSQEELADKLGISRQAISKWERAEASPDTDNLIMLAKLYNVSLDDLLKSDEELEELRKEKVEQESSKQFKEGIVFTDDDGSRVEIDNHSIKAFDKDGTELKIDKKSRIILSIIDSFILLLTLTGYLVWSLVFNAWEVSWTLWVLMPAVMSIFEAIFKKQITKFVYPCLVTFLYCFLGMQFGLWHPFWFLFITIPFFYIIGDMFDKYIFKTKPIDDEDDDDDEDEDEDD